MGDTGSFGFKGAGRRALELPDGASAAYGDQGEVSPTDRARLIYDASTKRIEASIDGGPYQLVISAETFAYAINGQSNALAGFSFYNDPPGINGRMDPFLADAQMQAWNRNNTAWERAQADIQGGAGVGQWGARLGKLLLEHGIGRVRMHQAGVSGQEISFFLPTETPHPNNYDDLQTAVAAGGEDLRVMFWHQGESDMLGGTTQVDYFNAIEALRTAWLTDYPTLERIVLFETAPNAGGSSTPNSDAIRAAQEQFANAHTSDVILVNVDDISSGTAPGYDGLHYRFFAGYEEHGVRGFDAIYDLVRGF